MKYYVAALAALVFACAHATPATLALVGGTVIDGNGGEPIDNGIIVVQDKRIVAVGGPSTPVPRGAKMISATGKYVIPGLMDANVHLVRSAVPFNAVRYDGRYDEIAIEAAQIALRSGLTTVFDSWGPREYLVRARNAINEGRRAGARIYLAGNIIGLGGPFSAVFDLAFPRAKDTFGRDFADRINAIWQENVGPELVMMTPEEVRQEIRKYAQKSVDFLKYAATTHDGREVQYLEFSPRVQQIIIEEGHRAGITVQTHTTSVEGLRVAVEAGADLLQHCDVIYGGKAIPDDTIALIADRKTPCAVFAYPDEAIAWFRSKLDAAPASMKFGIAHRIGGDRNQRALIAAGAVLLLSTDGGVFSTETLNSPAWKHATPPQGELLAFGEGHVNWLIGIQQKGMKPMDALLAATRNIARAYKLDKDIGTLEQGKFADLLVLDKNPLENAANYRSIHLVMKEGRVIDRDSLPNPRLLTAELPAH